MKSYLKITAIFSFVSLILVSCYNDSEFKEIRDFNNSNWKSKDVQNFIFEIKDTNKLYNIKYLLRNSSTYPFYNIYIKESLMGPGNKVLNTNMEEIILFDTKTGKPKGDGLGDIFDHKVQAQTYKNYKFPLKGKYKLSITHNMRPDPIEGFMSIGIEVAPVGIK